MSYTYYGVEPYTGNIIQHYGIHGQKKGKRRWQYPDGRFNEEGKERYFGSGSKKNENKVVGALKTAGAIGVGAAGLVLSPVLLPSFLIGSGIKSAIEKKSLNKIMGADGTLNDEGREAFFNSNIKNAAKILSNVINRDANSNDYANDRYMELFYRLKDYKRNFANINELHDSRNKLLNSILKKINNTTYKDYKPNTTDDYKFINFILGGMAQSVDPEKDFIIDKDFYIGPNDDEKYSRFPD